MKNVTFVRWMELHTITCKFVVKNKVYTAFSFRYQ